MKTIIPLKSATDAREYRYITLENGLRVTLVSDPHTVAAAAGVSVNVGSVHNPKELLGLAHFLEHMLFLGTEKFPDENSYNKYLAEHGGHSNAYTASEETVYYFDVHPDHLHHMLDIFSQFFIAPLFTASATERELNAVQNEHSKNLQSDGWRFDLLRRSRYVEGHPESRFHTGDIKSLLESPKEKGIDLRKELIAFHHKYYAARGMTACIVGKESLDELEEWATELFSSVPDRETPIPLHVTHPQGNVCPKNDLPVSDFRSPSHGYEPVGERVCAEPVKDVRFVEMRFVCPPIGENYGASSLSYLANLIGHEGPGSILSVLKEKSWANELSAGTYKDAHGYSEFAITITLTEKGLVNVDDVIALTFAYIRMLKKDLPEFFFDELRDINAMQFRFKGKEAPIKLVTRVCTQMQKFKANDVLIGPYRYDKFDRNDVESILNRFTPKKAFVSIVARRNDDFYDQTEPIYGTKYRVEPHSQSVLKLWEEYDAAKSLFLPKPNKFIATNFEIIPLLNWEIKRREKILKEQNKNNENNKTEENSLDLDGSKGDDGVHPVLLRRSSRVELWHKQDGNFKKPKVSVLLSIDTPHCYESPRTTQLSYMFVNCVTDQLNEYSYDAELAGLSFELEHGQHGLTLTLSGYNHKMATLMAAVMDAVTKPKFTQARFDELKDRHLRSLQSFHLRQPYQLADYEECIYIQQQRWHYSEYIPALESIRYDDVLHFAVHWHTEARLRAYVHGNATAVHAAELVRIAVLRLWPNDGVAVPPAAPPLARFRDVELSRGLGLFRQLTAFNSDDKNSVVRNSYRCGGDAIADGEETYGGGNIGGKGRVMMDLLALILGEEAFTELRTQQQLGYIVSFHKSRSVRSASLVFLIQSDTYCPIYLNWCVEKFIQTVPDRLNAMEESKFESYRDALLQQFSRRDRTMNEETRRYWTQIYNSTFTFDRREQDIEQLKSLTRQDIVNYFKHYVSNTQTRRKFSLQIFGSEHVESLEKHRCVNTYAPMSQCKPRDEKELQDETIETVEVDGVTLLDTSPIDASTSHVEASPVAFRATRAYLPLDKGNVQSPHDIPPIDERNAIDKILADW